jgi:hypothetical protein
MSTKRPSDQTRQDLAFTPTVRPINEADLDLVQRAMAEIAPDWSVELHGICADEATLVLLPEGGDDANGPSFMISRETYGLRLDQVHWDVMTELGTFVSLSDIVVVLGVRLAFLPDLVIPASATLH